MADVPSSSWFACSFRKPIQCSSIFSLATSVMTGAVCFAYWMYMRRKSTETSFFVLLAFVRVVLDVDGRGLAQRGPCAVLRGGRGHEVLHLHLRPDRDAASRAVVPQHVVGHETGPLRRLVVEDDEQQVETREQRLRQPDVEGHRVSHRVEAVHGVRRRHHGAAPVEGRLDAGLGDGDAALLHCFVHGHTVAVAHLVELVDAQHAAVREHHGACRQCLVAGVRVRDDGAGEPDAAASLTRRGQRKGRKLHHEAEQLRLGRRRLAHEQQVDVASDVVVVHVLLHAAEHLQQNGLLHLVVAEDGRRDGGREDFEDVGVLRHLSDVRDLLRQQVQPALLFLVDERHVVRKKGGAELLVVLRVRHVDADDPHTVPRLARVHKVSLHTHLDRTGQAAHRRLLRPLLHDQVLHVGVHAQPVLRAQQVAVDILLRHHVHRRQHLVVDVGAHLVPVLPLDERVLLLVPVHRLHHLRDVRRRVRHHALERHELVQVPRAELPRRHAEAAEVAFEAYLQLADVQVQLHKVLVLHHLTQRLVQETHVVLRRQQHLVSQVHGVAVAAAAEVVQILHVQHKAPPPLGDHRVDEACVLLRAFLVCPEEVAAHLLHSLLRIGQLHGGARTRHRRGGTSLAVRFAMPDVRALTGTVNEGGDSIHPQ
eukprot:Rhum_TRINITY_DN14606_c6_g1::Rhum_TRINITY_DN14606_c6_g1_i1::g.104133::m.104133